MQANEMLCLLDETIPSAGHELTSPAENGRAVTPIPVESAIQLLPSPMDRAHATPSDTATLSTSTNIEPQLVDMPKHTTCTTDINIDIVPNVIGAMSGILEVST